MSRAIQRLCNGYTSLPGLLEWGRLNAARLEGRGDGAGSLGDGSNGVPVHGLQTSVFSRGGGSGGDDSGGGSDSASDWRHSLPQRGATAAPGGGGGRYTERWGKGDRARSGRGSAESGITAVGERSSSSAFAVASSSCGAISSSSYSRLPGDRRDGGGDGGRGGAWSSSVTASLSSASAASLPERAPLAPSWHPDSADVYYLPKKVRGAGRDLGTGGAGGERRRLKTAGDIDSGGAGGGGGGNSSSSSSGGILCSADYGEVMVGSTWGGGETMAALVSDGGDLSGLGSHQGGPVNSTSSVASLLREERAYQRRSSALQW